MPNKTDVARRLAKAHYQVEAGITQIFRIVGRSEAELRPEEPIKLLEVNQFSIPSGVMPLYFAAAPARGIHFPSVIVEVTPEEFTKFRSQELKLPEGWTLGELFPKSEGEERPRATPTSGHEPTHARPARISRPFERRAQIQP